MNIYKILTLNYGNAQTYIVQNYDVVQAIQQSGINPNEVIRVELVDSDSVINNTDFQQS